MLGVAHIGLLQAEFARPNVRRIAHHNACPNSATSRSNHNAGKVASIPTTVPRGNCA